MRKQLISEFLIKKFSQDNGKIRPRELSKAAKRTFNEIDSVPEKYCTNLSSQQKISYNCNEVLSKKFKTSSVPIEKFNYTNNFNNSPQPNNFNYSSLYNSSSKEKGECAFGNSQPQLQNFDRYNVYSVFNKQLDSKTGYQTHNFKPILLSYEKESPITRYNNVENSIYEEDSFWDRKLEQETINKPSTEHLQASIYLLNFRSLRIIRPTK